MADAREGMVREFETSRRDNNYVMGQIFARYVDDEDPAGYVSIADYYKKLTWQRSRRRQRRT